MACGFAVALGCAVRLFDWGLSFCFAPVKMFETTMNPANVNAASVITTAVDFFVIVIISNFMLR